MGSFNNYVDRILPFFDPTPLRGQFLYPERGQKQTFFDPLPPHLVHEVIECPLSIKMNVYASKALKVLISKKYYVYFFF